VSCGGVEDGPSDLGSPFLGVLGFVGSYRVVLPDGSFDAEGVVCDVGGECSVGQVDVGVVAGVAGDGEFPPAV
jgi:hypothetical protein